jgi:hypothetical protein
MFDYNGKSNPAPALMWKLEVLEEEGEPVIQYWGAGKSSDFVPNADNTSFDAVGTKSAINNSTNFMMLMNSIVSAGFPEDKIGDSAAVFVGLECHMDRVSAYRKGLENTKDKTMLMVTKIHKTPWEKVAKGKPTKTRKAKPVSEGEPVSTLTAAAVETTEGSAEDALQEEAMECVLNILAEKGGEITKAGLVVAAQKALGKDNPNKTKLVQLLFNDGFLGGGPWSFASGLLKLA